MGRWRSSLTKVEEAKKAVKKFHWPKAYDIIKKIIKASKEGKESIIVEEILNPIVIRLIQKEGFTVISPINKHIIKWEDEKSKIDG